MHPTLQELADALDRARASLLATWASIPPDARERRPEAEGWTPAEVMEHLRVVEIGSTRLLARRLERAREAGLGSESPTAGSRLRDLDHLDIAGSTHMVEAPETVRPTPDAPAVDAEAGLAASRADLRTLLAAADGLALGEVRAKHMRFGDLDFYQWVLFLAQHEARHTRQLTRLRDALVATTHA